MEDWHIVALVFMIVVFLLVIALYAFLWSRSPFVGQRRAAPNLLYYYHVSGEVRVLDLTAMIAANGVSRDAIIAAIAKECGLDPTDVGLHRVDETLGVVIAIDDATFFSSDVRAANVTNTAAYPLLVRRVEPWLQKYQQETLDPKDVVPMPRLHPHETLIASDTPVYIIAVSYVRVGSDLMPLSASAKAALGVAPISDAWEHALQSAFYSHRHAIAVASAAASAAVRDGAAFSGGAEQQPLTPSPVVNVTLDSETIAAMDTASGIVTVWRSTVDDGAQPADAAARVPLMTLKRVEPPVVRYSYEAHADTWCMYTEPLQLPVGRWCVRVEATNLDRSIVHSTAKVYTVQQANYR